MWKRILLVSSVLTISVSDFTHSSANIFPIQRTRSLSGTPATDGNNVTNAEIYRIITQQLLGGFAVWRVKMYNDRVFVEKTRRSYWLGDRYFRMDNDYYWMSRDTCAYRMNDTERKDLKYEDGIPIYDIIYQLYDLEHPPTTPKYRIPRWKDAILYNPNLLMIVMSMVFTVG
ncbi:hypothetical protein KIN20_010262 [Parelaphostrongylus tenuis]|uniref:Uncharacterized protein n=1 Tax=Parelaphostrongylus tenuis TaxID=148309 RepID=A0AAD5MRP1_PARTN|nr:hypothetical protein KIN20_010262 [Parelaphostrongylus tenuis]